MDWNKVIVIDLLHFVFLTGPLNLPESVVVFNFGLERPQLVCGNFGSKLELPPDEPAVCHDASV